ncbi:MAG TPA: amino acid adenylation domain-containing protein, partial [Pseudomonadales bacterium]|nr:amino acid adenylation domain-containing protein [Pseudomonadales bacterium]
CNRTSKYPITFALEQTQAGYDVLIEYNTLMFNEQFIIHLFQHYLLLLQGAVANSFVALYELPMASPSELRLLEAAPSVPYPANSNLFSEFYRQSQQTPNAIALVSATEKLTYQQLAHRSFALAEALQQLGVRQGDKISLRLERSPSAIAVTLAITALGATYVPIDTRYPQDRINYICQECAVKFLLSDGDVLTDLAVPQLNLAEFMRTAHSSFQSRAVINVPAETTAYIMYTSGSTGTPKGVLVSHRNILRLVHGNFLPATPENCWLHYAPMSFDAATLEIWYPLLTGQSLAIAPAGLLTPTELKQFIQEYHVTAAWFTVALFNQLVDCELSLFSSLNMVLTGGDALSFSHVKLLKQAYPDVIVINGYGPTENTTFTTTHVIRQEDLTAGVIPIGRSLAHSSVHVLDEWRRPVGIHIPGELYAGGDGVSSGYLNNPELTALSFIDAPFASHQARKLYKTGDLVSFDENGLLYFHGRLDQQIKIRGFRIELSEIEHHLSTLAGVKNAIVKAIDFADSGKVLAAYIEMDSDQSFNAGELKSQLT